MKATLRFLFAVCGVTAQTITDGDTIKQGGVTYPLWGIDAPETKQDCPDGWQAGHLAPPRCRHS